MPFSLDSVAVQFLSGLASASELFLVASGLSIIFGVTRIVNFAHGSFSMLVPKGWKMEGGKGQLLCVPPGDGIAGWCSSPGWRWSGWSGCAAWSI